MTAWKSGEQGLTLPPSATTNHTTCHCSLPPIHTVPSTSPSCLITPIPSRVSPFISPSPLVPHTSQSQFISLPFYPYHPTLTSTLTLNSLHPSLLVLTFLPLTPCTYPKVLILQRVWRGTRVRLWLKRTKAVTLIALKFRYVCPY